MTRIAIIGARSHRALAQVWRRVRELPDDATVVLPQDGDVAAVAGIAARQRGLAVEHARRVEDADRLELFPWGDEGSGLDVDRFARLVEGDDCIVYHPDPGQEQLLAFSSRVSYAGPGRLQITRRGEGCDPMGLPFAPSDGLLDRALSARGQSEKLREAAAELRGRQLDLGETRGDVEARERRAAALAEEAEQIEADMWAFYGIRFKAEMRVSYGLTRGTAAWTRQAPDARQLAEEAWERGARPHPEAWRRLLARGVVVATCFCVDPQFCHRGILRAEILPALGAVDGGEVPCR